MDTMRAINHAIFNYLRTDDTLTILMGNANIHEGLAYRSDEFPYIIYAFNPTISPDTPVVADSDLQ
ncbi:unnamed protein product, partial [marine sediment metagenome]